MFRFVLTGIFSLLFCAAVYPQDSRVHYPFKIKNGHLYVDGFLNEEVQINVLLTSNAELALLDERFVNKNREKLGMTLMAPKQRLSTSLATDYMVREVKYLVKDTLSFGGKNIAINGWVTDLSDQSYDMILPIHSFLDPVEINFPQRRLWVGRPQNDYLSQFYGYDLRWDSTYRTPYISTVLTVHGKGGAYELVGDFAFHLLNANALTLNRQRPEVEEFLAKASKIVTNLPEEPHRNLVQIGSRRFMIAGITDYSNYLIAMKLDPDENLFSGILGVMFLQNFTVIFDRDKIYFKPSNSRVYAPIAEEVKESGKGKGRNRNW